MSKSVSTKPTPPPDKVFASPTKKFFVEMLTRDIELIDAIMDLVDNCIDGVHRSKKKTKAKDRGNYKGFYAHITLTKNKFQIKDNCGGIPENVAKNYAFKMGREDEFKDDDNLETVGVYGIGMKRAIFKLGVEANVISHHKDEIFQVTIPKNWATTNDWVFDFKRLSKTDIKTLLKDSGTLLSVTNLHKHISQKFEDKSGFITDIREKLQEHYGYIVQKGFEITVNDVPISSLELNIITSEPTRNKKSIKPYVYSATIDEVNIEVIIGFYRPPAEVSELEEGLDGAYAKSSKENAGITVLCNDRVVLYANKDHLTGWGDPPVPGYHTQFINIAGAVHFRSTKPIKIPVTTTKRGLDTSSVIYATVRNKIKEGLKYFTAFTNHWKASSEERSKLFRHTKTINALVPGQTKNRTFHLRKTKKGDSGLYQLPDLPKPDDDIREKLVTISYSKEKAKVDEMRDYFFDGEVTSASEIGAWCFEKFYSQID